MTTTRGLPATRPTAMYVGLALTILATVAPVLDMVTIDTITTHVRDAYPDWGPDLVAKDRDAIAIYLAATGALGIVVWLLTIRAHATGKRWARPVAAAACAIGTLIALTNLSMGGDHYHVIVPYTFGTLTLLPCVAGLVAVVAIWRRPRA